MSKLSELLASQPYVKDKVEVLRAAATVWMDARQHLLCVLSAEDNEWPDVTAHAEAKHLLEQMQATLDRMNAVAFDLDTEPELAVWDALDEVATRLHYSPTVNWENTNQEG